MPILTDAPVPTPAPGQARVRVAACGLNFADLLMIEGRYQERRPAPFTLGLECAGVVDALGPGTPGPVPGTRVLAFAPGAMAEALCLPADHLLPIPDAMTFPQAAGFPVAYGTSHLALDHRAHLQAGETLLVTGASGGVGLTAVELGARMGARVIAMARGADKLAVARAAGAHDLLDSDTPDLRDALRALGGCDVVYDTVGGPMFDPALRSLRPEGRYLAIGFASGTVPQIPANLLLGRLSGVPAAGADPQPVNPAGLVRARRLAPPHQPQPAVRCPARRAGPAADPRRNRQGGAYPAMTSTGPRTARTA